jgi:transcription antitermination factor NusG
MTQFSTGAPWDSNGGAIRKPVRAPGPSRSVATEPRWYALQIRPHFEKKADTLLRSKGLDIFLPLLTETHRWSDRRKQVTTPLFPGYAFARLRLSPETRKLALQTAGVIGFAGGHNEPVSVPASQIESLRQLLQADVDCAIRPFLCSGQRVRIRSGSLAGLVGILIHNTRKSLVISVESIRRSVSVAIEGYDLEVV